MVIRGSVWWIDFDSSVGREIRHRRPAVIISNDASNRHMNRVQVVPMTSNVDRLFPSEAYVTLNGRQSKALADQVQMASMSRLMDRAGTLSSEDMSKVEQALKMRLGLS